MIPMLTYARFLGLFVCVPLALTFAFFPRVLAGGRWLAMLVLLTIVYATTTLWDNAAVAMGFWEFDMQRTWGIKIWYLPLEEYLFFGLQSLLVGAWVLRRLERVR